MDRQRLRPADRHAADARPTRSPASRSSGPGRATTAATRRGLRAPADVPLRRGRLLRPVQRRRHRQLRRLPLQLHQQPDRRRRRAHRPGLHAHLHLQLPEPDVARPGPHARGGDVDLLRHAATPSGPVRRLGINLGAPGDRKADDGTLWLEYPSVGGPSPGRRRHAPAPKPRVVPPPHLAGRRRHATWVAASGAKGLDVADHDAGRADDGRSAATRCGCTSSSPTA